MRMLKMFWVISAMIILAAAVSAVGNLKTSILMNSSGSSILNLDTKTFSGILYGVCNTSTYASYWDNLNSPSDVTLLGNVNVSSIGGTYYVKPNNGTDIQVKLNLAKTKGGTVRITAPGTYTTTSSITINNRTRLEMDYGAWIKPNGDFHVIKVSKTGSFGNLYVNTTLVPGFTHAVVTFFNLTSYWGYGAAQDTSSQDNGVIKAIGYSTGNGSVFLYQVQNSTSSGTIQPLMAFQTFAGIDASGFDTIINIDLRNAYTIGFFNGNKFGFIKADFVKRIIKTRAATGREIGANDFGYIVYQDRRNTSQNALIDLQNAELNRMSGMFWDMEGDEWMFQFNNSGRNVISYASSAKDCIGKCGNNDLLEIGTATAINYGNLTRYYKNGTVQAKKLVSDTVITAADNITSTKTINGANIKTTGNISLNNAFQKLEFAANGFYIKDFNSQDIRLSFPASSSTHNIDIRGLNTSNRALILNQFATLTGGVTKMFFTVSGSTGHFVINATTAVRDMRLIADRDIYLQTYTGRVISVSKLQAQAQFNVSTKSSTAQIMNLSGTGNAVVCVNAQGVLYRNETGICT